MIHRLIEVTKNLYRGSAPTVHDVQWLKNNLHINKIVSLDRISGEKINKICKLLNIKHVRLYLDGSLDSLNHLLDQNLKKLLLDGGPTFIHCLHGKDRTGLVIAMFKCKYLGESPEKVIKEAKDLGFGVGVDPTLIKLYEKIIKSCKSLQDLNNADIVSNERSYIGDGHDSFLEEGNIKSFAPYLDASKQFPFDSVYLEINDQSPTRQNYKSINKENKEVKNKSDIPQVGIYNNDAGIQGAGPVEPVGGFIYE